MRLTISDGTVIDYWVVRDRDAQNHIVATFADLTDAEDFITRKMGRPVQTPRIPHTDCFPAKPSITETAPSRRDRDDRPPKPGRRMA